jgi:hypothetical protein
VRDISALNVTESLLGVFWGVIFAQWSFDVLQADSAVSIQTPILRLSYIGVAIIVVIALTRLIWLIQEASAQLAAQLTSVGTGRAMLGSCIDLLKAWLFLSILTGSIPLISLYFFKGLSTYQALFSSIAIPLWLGFIVVWLLMEAQNDD